MTCWALVRSDARPARFWDLNGPTPSQSENRLRVLLRAQGAGYRTLMVYRIYLEQLTRLLTSEAPPVDSHPREPRMHDEISILRLHEHMYDKGKSESPAN